MISRLKFLHSPFWSCVLTFFLYFKCKDINIAPSFQAFVSILTILTWSETDCLWFLSKFIKLYSVIVMEIFESICILFYCILLMFVTCVFL